MLINILRCSFSTFNCEGLQNGHEYRFRVYAENLHGRSDPSEPSEPVLIKPDEKARSKQRRRLGDGEPRGSYDGPPITDYDRFCELRFFSCAVPSMLPTMPKDYEFEGAEHYLGN